MADGRIADTAIDFTAFCFRRTPVEWPRLYDEMCNVASKRLYNGLGYDELKEAGVDLTFGGVARMSRIAKEVSRELKAARPAAIAV